MVVCRGEPFAIVQEYCVTVQNRLVDLSSVYLLDVGFLIVVFFFFWCFFFFFQAEDGIRDLVRSRGLGDVYKRQDVVGEP